MTTTKKRQSDHTLLLAAALLSSSQPTHTFEAPMTRDTIEKLLASGQTPEQIADDIFDDAKGNDEGTDFELGDSIAALVSMLREARDPKREETA
jgi:hypothetical protein